MMKRASDTRSDRGAALLIVLLLVATISVLAVSVVQTVSNSYKSALASASRSQLLWFAMGAEDLAAAKLTAQAKVSDGRMTSQTPGLNEPLVFELPNGQLTARFTDASNCFNLNSLAQTSEEAEATGAINAALYYQQLLIALGFDASQASELVSSLQDWIDGDNQPRTGGAETSYYAALDVPYAAANTFLVVPSELRSVRGYTKGVFQHIKRFVCARPDKAIGPYNINTLTSQHAPLLFPVFAAEIPVESLETELQNVSGAQHDSVKTFMSLPAFSVIAPDKRLDEILSIQSTYFSLAGEVVYLDGVTSYEAVFARDKANEVTLMRRRLGVDE